MTAKSPPKKRPKKQGPKKPVVKVEISDKPYYVRDGGGFPRGSSSPRTPWTVSIRTRIDGKLSAVAFHRFAEESGGVDFVREWKKQRRAATRKKNT